MPGRGGGKNTSNRSIPPRSIAPGKLQTLKQVARFNLCNKQDDARTVGKVKTKSAIVEDDLLDMVIRNLNRQRSLSIETERDGEYPNPTHDDLQHMEDDLHNVQDIETNGVDSQAKRKRRSKLASKVATTMPVNDTTNPKPREENLVQEEAQQENGASPQSDVIDSCTTTQGQVIKRKRTSKLVARVAKTIQVNEAANPREENVTQEEEQGNRVSNQSDVMDCTTETQAKSQSRGVGNRGKYKSYVVDMKIRGKGSKLAIEIPDEIDRAIGENARHLVNECGRVVRTKAPLNVKNWQEAFLVAGEGMWKEIQDKFQIVDSGKDLKMYAFVVDTMQRLYRLWKCRLHYYYKSPKCGKTDQERLKNPPPDLLINQWTYCVNHYASPEFKLVSERNSKNRLSANRCKHTIGNLAFAEVEDILTKNNNNVKPSADVIWMLQHTHCNDQGELEWADGTRSKEIHDKLKDVAVAGDSKTQEEILIEVLDSRSGYIRGKGTALRSYSRGKQQLEQRKLVQIQQEKIQEQEHRIKELEDSQRKQQQELEDNQQKQHQELEEYKRQQQEAMDAFKKDLLQQLASRGI